MPAPPASCGKAATALSDPNRSNVCNKLENCWRAHPQATGADGKSTTWCQERGLVLLSAYLLYRSFDQAMNLAKWDYKKHKDEFKALEKEMKPVRDLMETQLIPQWKKGNYANTQKSAESYCKA
ncbi:hypothetical protein OS493_004224 [Desmophyllum pertusum]|uniref:Uncharacterized protein n=1 Tax=Desmophyllum pertusum TaxID=174260 RepID=A0A9W9ZUA3_9CNID|nr:hypothetical protein OS493_004224 [Desmophyllum pertusum]